jgi:hypothetical protein
MWLIIALAVTFSIAAAVWVGNIARENVLQQHIRRLALETDQLSSAALAAYHTRQQVITHHEDRLAAAGSIVRPAKTPERLEMLTRLPPHRF